MGDRRCEQCENCFRHVESVYCDKAVKNCNKRHTPQLLTCAKCKEVRYCSRSCQKAQWRFHKVDCYAHVKLLLAVHVLGPKVERTFKAFVKFCKSLSGFLEIPAISALELQKGKERVETHVLFVIIKAKETILSVTDAGVSGLITFKVEGIECKTMQEMHDFLDWRAGPLATPEVTERTLSHRSGLLRIFVHDTSGILPNPLDGYTLPTDISNWPPGYHMRYDENWREAFFTTIGQKDDAEDAVVDLNALALMAPSSFHQIGDSNIGDLDLDGINLEELLPPELLEKINQLLPPSDSTSKTSKPRTKSKRP